MFIFNQQNPFSSILKFYPQKKLVNVCFQINDICNFNCSYCYEKYKTNTIMSYEIAKQSVDLLFDLYEQDNQIYPINKNVVGVIIEFIGGEPLLNIELIDYICTYFLEQCIEKNHIWTTNWMGFYISNGSKYFEPKVQQFIYKWRNFITPSISIDGPEYVHNLSRRSQDNKDTFSLIYPAFKHLINNKQKFKFQYSHTKIVITHKTLQYLYDIIKFFNEEKIDSITIQFNLEENWTKEDAKILYHLGIKCINYLNEVNSNLDINLFNKSIAQPINKNNLDLGCSIKKSLTFCTNGTIVPCNRFFDNTLNTYNLGNIYNFNYDLKLYFLDRQNSSPSKCFNCPIASGCHNCIGFNYVNTSELKRDISYCNLQHSIHLLNYYRAQIMNYDYPLQIQFNFS